MSIYLKFKYDKKFKKSLGSLFLLIVLISLCLLFAYYLIIF